MKQANQLALSFSEDLNTIKHAQVVSSLTCSSGCHSEIHVQTTGVSLAELCETIRNASQNSEESLQLIHAISRFIRPFFATNSANKLDKPGKNLIVELTLAGYLANDIIQESLVGRIDELIRHGVTLKNHLKNTTSNQQISRWIIWPLSSRIEGLLLDHSKNQAIANLAFNYFLQALDIETLTGNRPNAYEATLYMAVQKALLGSEDASIRLNLMDRYGVTAAKYTNYANFNKQIDEAMSSKLLDTLVRVVSRNGAVFRLIGYTSQDDDGLSQHLLSEKTFLGPFNAAIEKTYTCVNRRVNRGIIRSVIFLIITKFIIGIAIEVPYDLLFNGQIAWLPLGVNLLLPPLYMIMLRLTLAMPDSRNTRSLNFEASRILFQPQPGRPFISGYKHHFSRFYNALYVMVIIGVFGGVGWLLVSLAKFEWIHLAIFFVFISTASFLGFRLSRVVREIEVGDETQTTASILRDFIYMPFVAVGQKISETYSKINIISRMLDMFVELPIKTIVRFLRRWGSFMSTKRDDL